MLEHASDIVVDGGDSSQVVLDVALILPAHEVVALQVGCAERVVLGLIGRVPNFELLGREPLGRDELQIAVRQIARDGHRLLRRRRAASGVVVEECFRLGDLDVVIHREMVGPRIPTAVRRFVLAWIPTEPFGPNIRVSAVA